MRKLILLITLFSGLTGWGQVPLNDVVEDKNDMADKYYGTFKYQGQPYTGQAVAYHDNGLIRTLRNFKDGMYQGYWTEWYANGNRKFQGDRVKNMGNGLTKWWYENGQLKKQGTYDMDKQQGVVLRWYDNGNLSQIRHYEQDKAVGPWVIFDRNGDVLDEGDDKNKFYRPFFGNDIAPDGFEETSPSFTSDGKTMVFARYSDWMKKVPYMAELKNGKWIKKQLPIKDTLYNLAISPDGNRIVYKTFEYQGDEEITRAFVVDKKNGEWGESREVESLYNINAGYFQIMDDGALFMFARSPKTGIFYSKPVKKEIYTVPEWLSDDVSMPKSDSFDVLMNQERDKLIVTQAFSKKRYPDIGEIGMYYYKKVNDKWQRVKRLPIGYAWGATITPDNKFVFVRNGNIQYIPLKELGIDW